MNKIVGFSFLLLLLLLISCNPRRELIPFVPVNVFINIQDPQYNALMGITGWVYVEGGSRGIIVYRSDLNTFVAMDRHSTFKPENPCGGVVVDNNNITATDTCSGAVYQLMDGAPFSGPSEYGLQLYRTQFDGVNILRIFN